MAKEDEFVEKLSDFTRALESLVGILQEQAKNNPTEALAQFLGEIDADVIANIAENLKEVKTTTQKTEKNTEKIIQQLKEDKKQKESGMFGETEDKKNKNKIVEGVKTIILIAGAVLAVGMAFKIVGKVDFLSVVALGLGIMFVAYAFAQVASVKDDEGNPITYKRAFEVSIIMSIMALGVVGAGFVLKMMPTIGIMQGVSAILVGVSMGFAAYALLNAVQSLTMKQILMAAAIPILLPLIAAGVVAAAYILQNMPVVGFMQVLSAIGVAIALVPITIAFGFLMKSMKDANVADILMVGLAIPVIAAGILVASLILQNVVPVPFWNVLLAGIAIGIATLFMVPTIFLLQKAGLLDPSKIVSLVMGAAAIVILSAAIMASSWLLSMGTYDTFPTWQWGLGAGLAILMFTPALVVLGILSMTGVGLAAIAVGAIGAVIVAATIMAVSYILGVGSYDTYPTLEWSLGVGLALIVFIPAMIAGIVMALLGSLAVPGTLLIASTIVMVSYILSNGKYDVYPTLEWSLGVGLALIVFIPAMIAGIVMALLGTLAVPGTLMIAFTIVAVSYILSLGKYDVYPTTDWAGGVGLALIIFIPAMIAGIVMAILGPLAIPGTLMIALTIVAVSYILAAGQYDLYPTTDWAGGVGLALILFVPAMILAGLSIVAIALGVPAILMVAASFLAVSHILAAGNYSKYPSTDWAGGAGLALILFGAAAMTLGSFILGGFIIGGYLALTNGIAGMLIVAEGIVAVGNYFNENAGTFNVNNVPSEEWAKGVGNALLLFAQAIAAMDEVDVDVEDIVPTMLELTSGLIQVGYLLSATRGFFDPASVPSVEWSENVKTAIMSFHSVLKKLEEDDTNASEYLIKAFFVTLAIKIAAENLKDASSVGLPNPDNNPLIGTMERLINLLPTINVDPIYRLADAIMYLRDALSPSLLAPLGFLGIGPWQQLYQIADGIGSITESVSKLSEEKALALYRLAMGLNLLGLVNNEALEKTLSVIEEKQKSISQISDTGGKITTMERTSMGEEGGVNEKTGMTKEEEPVVEGKDMEILTVLQSIDKNIEIIVNRSSSAPLEKGQDVDRD